MMEPRLPSVSCDHLTSWFSELSADREHPDQVHTAIVASILAFASSNGAEKMSVSCDCRALRIACRSHAAMNNVSHPRAQPGSAQVGKVWVISQLTVRQRQARQCGSRVVGDQDIRGECSSSRNHQHCHQRCSCARGGNHGRPLARRHLDSDASFML